MDLTTDLTTDLAKNLADTTKDLLSDQTKDALIDLTRDVTAKMPTETSITLFEFFMLGGWAMWPLLIFSIATVSLIVERALKIFFYNDLSMIDIRKNVLALLDKNDVKGAIKYCDSCDEKLVGAPIISECLQMAELGEHRMEKAIEAEAAEKINELENGFNFLVALGSIAPITGFLGTVSGMIGSFKSIANAADVNAQLVSEGIFEALITTAYGLSIAIVAIAAYNIFAHFVDKFAADIEQTASDVITSILIKNKK